MSAYREVEEIDRLKEGGKVFVWLRASEYVSECLQGSRGDGQAGEGREERSMYGCV